MQSLSKYPNIAVIISSFFWGTYWIPIRKINEGGNESIWPIILAFIILSILLIKTLVEVFKRIFKKKDIYFLLGNFFCCFSNCIIFRIIFKRRNSRGYSSFLLMSCLGDNTC